MRIVDFSVKHTLFVNLLSVFLVIAVVLLLRTVSQL